MDDHTATESETSQEPSRAKIVLGVVARKRPAMLQQLLNSAIALVGDVELQGVVLFDDDPIGMRLLPKYDWVTPLQMHPRVYYVQAANSLVAWVLQHVPDADYIAIVDDDTEFIQAPWGPTVVNFFRKNFPDDMGLMDLFSYQECCHAFTSLKFIKEELLGMLYDPMYRQFYHDTALRYRVMGKFAHINDIGGRPFFVHKRDFMGGASVELHTLKQIDANIFKSQSAVHGWSQFSDALKPEEPDSTKVEPKVNRIKWSPP